MKCKGCNEEKKLVKAHIIPESFFSDLRDGDNPLALLTNTSGIYPKRANKGIYDKNILCRDCEDIFQTVDNYGQKILLHSEQEQLISNGIVAGFKVDQFDYKLLKLFFLSILWRSSVSTHKFYSKIALGPFEDAVKKLIWNNSPGAPDEFSCILAKFTDEKIGKIILNPHRDKLDQINYYRFYLSGYILYIKVDKRHSSSFYKPFVINKNDPLIIIARDIKNSKEYQILLDIIRKSKK